VALGGYVSTARPPSHGLTWVAFIAALLLAAGFILATANQLPSHVAVHFDAGGAATSFMSSSQYRLFILVFAIALPIVLVATLRSVYSRAKNFNLPNREYWLAPQRIDRTRSFLVAHGVWFGTLFTGLMGFMHWLVLDANRRIPPTLSNQAFFIGLLAFLGCMVAWLGTLLVTFRRP
jgi:uncharacterized membrane protein